MTYTLTLTGKGSSGKTTLAPALLAALRRQRPDARILVLDCDPHQSLTTLLGLELPTTLGRLRSDYERALLRGTELRQDESREAFLEARMGDEALYAADGYDVLALGQWELPGSQCTPNRVMERALDRLLGRYDIAVFDHEAGIEHIGRFVAFPIDDLFIVSTPDRMALDVAARIWATTRALERPVRRPWLLLNRVRDAAAVAKAMAQPATRTLLSTGVQFLGRIAEAPEPIDDLPADHPWHTAVAGVWPVLAHAAAEAA